MDTLLLVDGNSLINRAYYATSLTNGATYGFFNMLLKEIIDTKCTHVIVTFDTRARTFRHEMYDGYKANRKPMPEDLATQLFDTKELLSTIGIRTIEMPGFEADDLIGTIAKTPRSATTPPNPKNTPTGDGAKESGQLHTIILTADRDMLQLVDDDVSVYLTKTGVSHIEQYDPARIRTEMGIEPAQIVDVKSLAGDVSDNIPGVRGIGEKTAIKYIIQYGSADAATADPKLSEHAEVIRLSRDLAQIKCDVAVDVDIDATRFALPMGRQVMDAFKQRRFNSLVARREFWREEDLPKAAVQLKMF